MEGYLPMFISQYKFFQCNNVKASFKRPGNLISNKNSKTQQIVSNDAKLAKVCFYVTHTYFVWFVKSLVTIVMFIIRLCRAFI